MPGLKDEKELPPIKVVKTDHSNLHISRDEFIAKHRREKEMEVRLELERQKILQEFEEEEKVKKPKGKNKKVKETTDNTEGNVIDE